MRRIFTVPALLALAIGAGLGTASAQTVDTSLIPHVQEDWELVIATPNSAKGGPQISTFMSPSRDENASFVVFNLNYRDEPKFEAGGMQTQAWKGKTLLDHSTVGTTLLNTPNETIRWTQKMMVKQGVLSYKIIDGSSTTFGNFGPAYGLREISYPTSQTGMDGYSPDISVSRSGAGWLPDRVSSMTLLRVRYYNNEGNVHSEDSTPRQVNLPK